MSRCGLPPKFLALISWLLRCSESLPTVFRDCKAVAPRTSEELTPFTGMLPGLDSRKVMSAPELAPAQGGKSFQPA